MIPADDEEDAVRIANDTIYGLNASVFTNDVDRARQVAARLRSGTVGHNAFRTDFGVAFGGFKQSGIGREGGTRGSCLSSRPSSWSSRASRRATRTRPCRRTAPPLALALPGGRFLREGTTARAAPVFPGNPRRFRCYDHGNPWIITPCRPGASRAGRPPARTGSR